MQMGSLVCLHSGLEFNIFKLMKHVILLYNLSLWLHFHTNGPMTQGIIYYNNDGKICFAVGPKRFIMVHHIMVVTKSRLGFEALPIKAEIENKKWAHEVDI